MSFVGDRLVSRNADIEYAICGMGFAEMDASCRRYKNNLTLAKKKKKLRHGESNPGLPRDRRGY